MNHLVEEIHATAKEKGWWPTFENGKIIGKPSEEVRMLIVSEIAEATEEVRKQRPPIYQEQVSLIPGSGSVRCVPPHATEWNVSGKPEGEAIELADAVIRILDYFGAKGWHIDHHMNDHVDIYESDSGLVHHMQFVEFVSKARGADEEKNLGRTVVLIGDYFKMRGWDLERAMRLKIDYNKTRPFRHGGKAH